MKNQGCKTATPERLTEIDGLRGWAALSVVIFHAFYVTFSSVHSGWPPSAFMPLIDGTLDVCIFFILSGDALSTGYISGGSRLTLNRMIAKRYFRLSIPILLTVIPTWALMLSGLIYSPKAFNINNWLGYFLDFRPSFWDAVKFSLAGVYGWIPAQNYNDFLWTMPIELYGSLMIFLYLSVIHHLRTPLIVTLFFILCTSIFSRYFELFFVGVFLAQLRALGILGRIRRSIYAWVGGLFLLLVTYSLEVISYSVLPGKSFIPLQLDTHLYPLVATMFVVGSYISLPVLAFFRCRVSAFLGRVSFGIYLIQFPMLCSFECFMIVTRPSQLGWSLSFALEVAGATVLLTVGIATVFSRIDNYLLRRVDILIGKQVQQT